MDIVAKLQEEISQLKENLEESESHNKYTIEESNRAVQALRENSNDIGFASWRERIWWLESRKLIEKYQKSLNWIAKSGWQPHGMTSENAALAYDCHCVAAQALSNDE